LKVRHERILLISSTQVGADAIGGGAKAYLA